jgi:flagella basal body P-ring formation protein FlgA
MRARLTGATILMLALAGHAATLTLLPEVVVRGAQVRLVEIAAAEGTAEELARVETAIIAPAPAPGERRVISRGLLDLRLRQYGLGAALLRGAESVTVTRAAQTVTGDTVLATAETWLRGQIAPAADEELLLTPPKALAPLVLPDGVLAWECRENSMASGATRTVQVSATVDGAPAWRGSLTFRMQRTALVLIARQALGRGDALEPRQVVAERRDITGLRGSALRDPAEVIGLRLRTALSPGAILTADALEPIPVVLRNSTVSVRAERGALTILLAGIACEDGAIGQIIRVRNPQSHLEFTAEVLPSGDVRLVW